MRESHLENAGFVFFANFSSVQGRHSNMLVLFGEGQKCLYSNARVSPRISDPLEYCTPINTPLSPKISVMQWSNFVIFRV